MSLKMSIEQLLRAGLATKRICLKTELTKTRTALYVWDDGKWNDKLHRTMLATADYFNCKTVPNVLLVGHIDKDDDLYTYLVNKGMKCDLIVMTRKWLENYPTFLIECDLKNIMFIEDLKEFYEYVPVVPFSGPFEQAMAVAIILNRRCLYLPRVGTKTAIQEFYEKHVGTIHIGKSIDQVVPDIVLIQQYFKHPAPARRAEFLHCLERNTTFPYIDRLVMLVEDDMQIQPQPKMTIVNIHKRLTYGDALRWAVANLPEDTIVIIANLDIYFDHTLGYVYDLDMKSKCLALLRHEVMLSRPDTKPVLFGPRPDSQDAWIFQLPLPASAKLHEPGWNIELGRPGCDNSIIYELVQRRFCVANPAYTIRALHVHETGVRDYNVSNLVLRPAYLHIEPSVLRDYDSSHSSNTQFKNAFVGPDGSVYDFKTCYVGTPPLGVMRAIVAPSIIAVDTSTTDSTMKDPYKFLTCILPRLMKALEQHPDAECRLPDSPELFSSLLSYMAWPVPTVKTIPYHPRLAVWSPLIYSIAAGTPEPADVACLRRALEPVFVDVPAQSSSLKHIAYACNNDVYKALCDAADKIGVAWGGIKNVVAGEKTIEHVGIVRNSHIVVCSADSPTGMCFIFAKTGTRVVEIGGSTHAKLAKMLGMNYVGNVTIEDLANVC